MERILIVLMLLGFWFTALLVGGSIGFSVLLSVVALASTCELALILFQNRSRHSMAAMIIGGLCGVGLIWNVGHSTLLLESAVASGIGSVLVWGGETRQKVLQESVNFLGRLALILLILLCLAGLARLRAQTNGLRVVLLVSVCTLFRDLMSNLGGRSLRAGKAISNFINESKTWGGAAIGCIGTVALGMGLSKLPLFQGFALLQIVLVSLACGVGGQIGDLFESLLKRSAGVRDSSKIFRSQGGMLDAIDGFIVAVPLAEALYLFRG